MEENATASPAQRLGTVNWQAAEADLDTLGYMLLPGVLDAADCAALTNMMAEDAHFRRRINMARHAFGEGDYAYFAEPLPPLVATLRETLYAYLAPIADRMTARMRRETRFPATLTDYRAQCAAAGQTKPTVSR